MDGLPLNWSELDCILCWWCVGSDATCNRHRQIYWNELTKCHSPLQTLFQMENCHERFQCVWSRHEWTAHSKTLTTTKWCIDRHAYWTVSCLSRSVCQNEMTRHHQRCPFQMQSIVWCHVLQQHSAQRNYDDSSYGNISNWYLFLPCLANVGCIACKNPSVSMHRHANEIDRFRVVNESSAPTVFAFLPSHIDW